MVKALEDQGEDVDVRCSNGDGVGGNIAFRDMLHATEHSIFALALPGDSPSSRRLSEIFLAGETAVTCESACMHIRSELHRATSLDHNAYTRPSCSKAAFSPMPTQSS